MASDHRTKILCHVGIRTVVCALALPLCAGGVPAQQTNDEVVGTTYEISRDQETSEKGSNESTSSSTDRDTLLERVIEHRANGMVLEYDLPRDATADDRSRNWQFPARILLSQRGDLSLLNADELNARLDKWLKDVKLPRAACGHWIFTWNAFKIECDPQSVLATIKAFNLRGPAPQDGAAFADARAAMPSILKRTASNSNGSTFVAELKIDPDRVRRDQAQSDVVIGEITKKPVTLENALQARAGDTISGAMTVTLETDDSGNVRRRITLMRLETKRASGDVEDRTVTETVERKPISTAPDKPTA